MQSEYQVLEEKANKLKKTDENIASIILFGSVARGKKRTGDIDVCVITKKEARKTIKHVKKILGKEYHTTILTIEDMISEGTLARTIINEGYELIKKKNLAELFGYEPRTLFIYSLKNLNHNQKTRFTQALSGRNKKDGVIDSVKGKRLGPGAILIPLNKTQEFEEFMQYWKTSYETRRVLIEQ